VSSSPAALPVLAIAIDVNVAWYVRLSALAHSSVVGQKGWGGRLLQTTDYRDPPSHETVSGLQQRNNQRMLFTLLFQVTQ